MFALRPSREAYEAILRVNHGSNSFDGTDQGLLNSYCAAIGRPWYFSAADSPTCNRLPMAYVRAPACLRVSERPSACALVRLT